MTLAELRLEVRSRLNGPGYRFLSDTRVDRFVNQARAQFDAMYLWPWREKSTTGVAPVTITDLGAVEAVINTSQNDSPLTPLDYRHLLDAFSDLSTSGHPNYYYRAQPSSPEIATYPTSSTDVIGVQYWKVTVDLSSDSDTPAAPAELHHIIVDMATQIGLRANRHHDEAAAYQAAVDRDIERALQAYPVGLADYSGTYVSTVPTDY